MYITDPLLQEADMEKEEKQTLYLSTNKNVYCLY